VRRQRTADRKKGRNIELLKRKAFKASIVAILAGLFVYLAAAAFSQTQKSFLWKTQSNTATVYLLGSVHFLKTEAYPLSRAIENAYDLSDVLVVEANVNDLGNLNLTAFMDRAFYQGEDHVQKHVTTETYRLIRKESAVLGLPMAIIDRQKPWFLALFFQAMELMKRGYDPRHGVDYYFLSKAAGKKRILELESLDEQIDLLAGFSDTEQELFLVYTLENLKSLGTQADAVVQAWASGEAPALESLLNKSVAEDGSLSPVYEKLIDHRNAKMTSRIESYLAAKGTYLVIVGAAHLVGSGGIVERIRSKGYHLEQQ
jgi:uncharacterized protein YbaP (TraB family)